RVSPGDNQFSPERRLSPPDCQYTNNSRTTADRRTASSAGVARVPPTPRRDTVTVTAVQARDDRVPLTPGRDTGVDTKWNAWSELTGVNLSDRRYGLDTKNCSYSATAGLDRQLAP